MSCERQQAEVQQAAAEFQSVKNECDQLEAVLGPNAPEVLSCRTYQFVLEGNLQRAEEELRLCREAASAKRVLIAEGLVAFLRVHELKTGFGGGQSNFIPAEAIFRLETRPDKAFGFELRDDKFLPARQGMLSLLREAMVHDLRVIVDYLEPVTPPNQNCYAIRIALTKSRQTVTPPVGEVLAR
jgi:hypothetical protein